jgi:predicted esterase
VRVQNLEYSADGARMIGEYAVDEARDRPPSGHLVLPRGQWPSQSTPKGSLRGSRASATPLSPWTTTATASRWPTRPSAASRLAPGAPIGPAFGLRAHKALETLAGQKEVDPARLAVIGYCFGGTTALEIGRSGGDVKAIVGFHSGLGTPEPQDAKNIKAKVLVCIGARIPSSRPSSARRSSRR